MSLRNSSGVHFSDPRQFHRQMVAASVIACAEAASSTTDAANTAQFFTNFALNGVADNTNWTATTYKTLLSVTGAGFVNAIIGPTGLAGTPTTTFRITVDGVVYTVALTATTTG